jgi:hypothetical protein
MKTLRLSWVPLLILGLVAALVLLIESASPTDSASVGSAPVATATETVPAEEPAGDPVASDSGDGSFQEYITFWARIGVVEFPHEMHSEDFGMECVECHHETNAAALKIPHMDYFDDFWIDCSECHKPNGDTVMEPQSCSVCHHTDPTGIADESLSSKVVIHKLCWDCHDSGTGADASESCSSCHNGERTSFMAPLPDSLRTN